MSRGFAFAGVCLAAGCGVLITYSTLRPELEKQRAERRGEKLEQLKNSNDKALSQAILSDLKEARDQVKPTQSKGFAWGIREAIWGPPNGPNDTGKAVAPVKKQEEMATTPQEAAAKVKGPSAAGG